MLLHIPQANASELYSLHFLLLVHQLVELHDLSLLSQTQKMALQVGFVTFSHNSIIIIFLTLSGANEDYTAVSGETIQFNVGDTMKTHTITIKQDMSCESTNVFFYSTISLSSGISMIQPRVRVIIDDSGETECGKC